MNLYTECIKIEYSMLYFDPDEEILFTELWHSLENAKNRVIHIMSEEHITRVRVTLHAFELKSAHFQDGDENA